MPSPSCVILSFLDCLHVWLLFFAKSCPTLCDPMNCSIPGLPVHHQLPVYPNPCPLSQWCHPTISSSVVPFSSWEICMQVKKQQLELDMEQQTGSKSRKECTEAVYCHPAYLTYMQSTSWEMLGWMKHKLESRLPGEIRRWHHPYGRKWRRAKEPLDESERGEWKKLA